MLAKSPVLAKEPKESKKKLKITRINKFPVGINRMSKLIQRNVIKFKIHHTLPISFRVKLPQEN